MTTLHDSFNGVELLDPGQPFSRLDRFSRFNGRYEAMQNLLIEGACEGEIDCRGTLVIAEGASASARIFARDIRVAGTLDGEVECSGRFELLPTARASGSVRARQIIVREGAEFDGELQMSEDHAVAEPEEGAPAPWQAAIEPAPAVAQAVPESETRAFVVGDDATIGEDIAAEAPPSASEDEPEDLPDFLRRKRD